MTVCTRLLTSPLSVVALLAILLAPTAAAAKKVVCIDGHDDTESGDDRTYISNYEGYVRSTGIAAGDVIRVTGSLTDVTIEFGSC